MQNLDPRLIFPKRLAHFLPVGSQCVFGNSVEALSAGVSSNARLKFKAVVDGRFLTEQGGFYNFAYLLDVSTTLAYKPYPSIQVAMSKIIEHKGWLYNKRDDLYNLVTDFRATEMFQQVKVGGGWVDLQTLVLLYSYRDDGTPCGFTEGW